MTHPHPLDSSAPEPAPEYAHQHEHQHEPPPEQARYPLGRFDMTPTLPAAQRPALIVEIARAPAHLRQSIAGLTPAQLNTPYRTGGWTVRQVVHHVADSHMNAYFRFKLALTEDVPRIKTYDEKAWAELADTRTVPVDISLALLDALHRRWVALLESMDDHAFDRTLDHPELGPVSLTAMLRLYEWHGRHHVAHITSLRKRMGW